MHYFIIIAIIAIIVIIQLRFFADTKQKIRDFFNIFPKGNERYTLSKLNDKEYKRKIKEIDDANFDETIELCERYNLDSAKYIYQQKDEEGNEQNYFGKGLKSALIAKVPIISGISVKHNNSTLQTIINSINDYLQNNKSVCDFHLLKDIVDRNCDAKEEEINTQIPVPLYLGLVGTMLGILIGVGFLVFDGSLAALLGNETGSAAKGVEALLGNGTGNGAKGVEALLGNGTGSGAKDDEAKTVSGAKGVEALLGGVAVAMISSVLGIILTTLGSIKFKTAKSIVEANEHIFLSWIQAKLLPTLSDNVVGAIREMTGNLENFNKEFAQNTDSLGSALEKVNESYKMHVQLLNYVRQIADKELTKQNLQLYTALQNSTKEIGTLAEYLKNCNQYLANVQTLNKKLDDYENRTQFIEKASQFYSKHEKWLEENYDVANRNLAEVVGKYNTAIEDTFKEIKSDIEGKRQELGTFIDTQNKALTASAGNLDEIVKALTELGEVQKGIIAFESAIKGQNTKIDRLAEHIEILANAKSSGGALQIQQKTPIWQIALIGVIALSCTVLAVNSFIKSEPKAEKTETIQSQPVIQAPIVPAMVDSTAVLDSIAE